jgi:hypothetical protein
VNKIQAHEAVKELQVLNIKDDSQESKTLQEFKEIIITCQELEPNNKSLFKINGSNNLIISPKIYGLGEFFFYIYKVTKVVLPNSITTLENYCFHQCEYLEVVILPDSLISMGEFCFAYAYKLVHPNLGGRLQSIGESIFSYCKDLWAPEIPNSLVTVGKNSFVYCEKLAKIIQDQLTRDFGRESVSTISSS